MIFSQRNDPAPPSWWVSLIFGWCWALNELWTAHAVTFIRITITRCHPCRSKPRLVLFLFLLRTLNKLDLFEYPLSTKVSVNSILASGTNISRKNVLFLSLPNWYMYNMHPNKRHRPGPVIIDLELCLKSNIPSLPSLVHTFFHLLLFPSYYLFANWRQLDLHNADACSMPSVSELYKGSVRGTWHSRATSFRVWYFKFQSYTR